MGLASHYIPIGLRKHYSEILIYLIITLLFHTLNLNDLLLFSAIYFPVTLNNLVA